MLLIVTASGKGMSHSWYADLSDRDARDVEKRLKKAVGEGKLESFSIEPAPPGQYQAQVFPYRSMLLEISDFIAIVGMTRDVSRVNFEPLRTMGWKGILIRAFQVLPRRLEEILVAEGWREFTEFMAAVGRSGRVLLQYKHPSIKTIQEKGEIQKFKAESNTEAMLQLLSGAFYGEQGGEPDLGSALEALSRMEIRSWYELSHAVLEVALALYADRTGGMTPLDMAKVPTRLFYEMKEDSPPHQVVQVTQAFGLESPRHFTALLSVFYAAEVTLEDLDLSVGDYSLMTEIVNRAPSNPEPGIVFRAPEEFKK